MPRPAPPLPRWQHPGWLGLSAGIVAGLAVLVTLGSPGITIDEPIDVKVSTNYIRLLSDYTHRDPSSLGRAEIDALFLDNKQHPPLGRLLLGITTLAAPLEPWLGGIDPFSVHSARLAPMTAFALLVGLIVRSTARRYGTVAGLAAGIALVFMPRSFAHAHFATLDTFLSLFWTASLLAADGALLSEGRKSPRMAAAGLVWGLALLTKIHAWLLPPLVALDALLRLRSRPRVLVLALAAWTAVGLLVFLVGWPWLWPDPVGRLRAFLSTSVDRVPLSVLYFGQVYQDNQLPWHYPWVQFGAAVPVGLHLLAIVGLVRGWKDRKANPLPLLLALSVVQFLVLFSTNAPVYDGERLFLHVFPAWAILAGLGFDSLWKAAKGRGTRVALAGVLAAQGYGLAAFHPFQLSYHSALVGGLPGAVRLGLEPTYWGDVLDNRLLRDLERRAEPGDRVAVIPTMHHLYPPALTTPGLAEKGIKLLPEQEIRSADWAIISRRVAYWPPSTLPLIESRPASAERSRQGVWLSRLIRLGDEPAETSGDVGQAKTFRTN
jgi:4-amino-4-deoxy-L-arabinose transferase-like glycosyltransferase